MIIIMKSSEAASRILLCTSYAYAFIYECNAWYIKQYVRNSTFFSLQLIIPVSHSTFLAFVPFSSLLNANSTKRRQKFQMKQRDAENVSFNSGIKTSLRLVSRLHVCVYTFGVFVKRNNTCFVYFFYT